MKANWIPIVFLWASGCCAAHELISHQQIEIDRPAMRVWPHILDIGSWKKGNRLEHVAGERNAVGETFAALSVESREPDYYVKTVELVPAKRRTIKLYGTGPTAPLIGYASWELEEVDGRTRLSYHVYTDVPSEHESAESQSQYVATNNARFRAELQYLKELIEN